MVSMRVSKRGSKSASWEREWPGDTSVSLDAAYFLGFDLGWSGFLGRGAAFWNSGTGTT